jgi:deoxyribodipyrimidine photo-lyase
MTVPPTPPIIVWLRDDLRLSDHPALHAAARAAAPVICLFVLDEASPGLRPLGGAARWWLAQSVRALEASLKAKGASLVLRRGPASKVVADVAREAGAGAVFWNGIAHAPHLTVARQLETTLAKLGVETKTFPGDLLVSPNDIRNKNGRGLRVFTPFWRRVLAQGDMPTPLPAPKSLRPAEAVRSDVLESLGLEPHHPDWAGGLRETWSPGEKAAQARLKDFLKDGAKGYTGDRDRPDRDSTSSLSPHLRFESARVRSGTLPASRRPSIAGSPAISKSSSAN